MNMCGAPLFKVTAEMLNYVRIRTLELLADENSARFYSIQGIKVCNPFCNLIIWKWKILYKTPPELTSIWISFEQQMQILILENVQAEWIVESNLHYSMTFHLHTSVLEV